MTLLDRPAAYGVISQCLEENRSHNVTRLGRIFGARPVHPNAQSWFIGALGELEVAQALSKLGPEWTVLHSVPIGEGESDVDHLAIGPAGVFAINTKHHAGKRIWVSDGRILVAGQKVDHLRNSRNERVRVKRMLELATHTSVPVEAMLVFVSPESITFKQRPSDVTVLSADRLASYVRKQETIMSPSAVDEIVGSAIDVRTWHPTADVTVDHDQLTSFADLRKASSVARVKRLLWLGVATITVVGAAMLLLPMGFAALARALG